MPKKFSVHAFPVYLHVLRCEDSHSAVAVEKVHKLPGSRHSSV